MPRKFYPAVLERGAKGAFAIWFPDFPSSVAGGVTQQEALEKAELALARVVDAMAEADQPLPDPTSFEKISLPKNCRPVAYFAVGDEPLKLFRAGDQLFGRGPVLCRSHQRGHATLENTPGRRRGRTAAKG
jgi:predicted RNase H-like HicB family nuclease